MFYTISDWSCYESMNINDAIIIKRPKIGPKIPSLPCLGVILVRISSAFALAASFFDKKYLLIKPKPNIKANMVETMLPVKSVIHQIGEDANQPKFRRAVVTHLRPRQKTTPIQPWYGSTFSKST